MTIDSVKIFNFIDTVLEIRDQQSQRRTQGPRLRDTTGNTEPALCTFCTAVHTEMAGQECAEESW